MSGEATFWNGEPCEARRVRVVVADAPEFPMYWARDYVGQERDAVEVTYRGRTFYIDDEAHTDSAEVAAFLLSWGVERHQERLAGRGWAKVTEGRGGPRVPHSSLSVASVTER